MFADCLERTLAADQAAPVPAAGSAAEAVPGEPTAGLGPSAQSNPEAIDLLEAAGVPILKRALPALAAVVALVLLWRILRQIRS
jgi:hypothetical protein